MKVVERDGKKYLVLQEKPEPVELEIVEELGGGKYKVKLRGGGVITFDITPSEMTEEERTAIEELEKAEEEWMERQKLNERQEAILHYLLERNEPVPYKEIVNHILQHYDVSAPMVQRDLERLLEEKLVEKVSRGLYKITKSGMSYLGATPPGLYYECTESNLLKAIELVIMNRESIPEKLHDELYQVLVDALDCLRDLGGMYQKEWDIEIPLD